MIRFIQYRHVMIDKAVGFAHLTYFLLTFHRKNFLTVKQKMAVELAYLEAVKTLREEAGAGPEGDESSTYHR